MEGAALVPVSRRVALPGRASRDLKVLRYVAERMPARQEGLHSAHSISKIALHAFMDLTADELARISELTIGHYNRHAEAYWQGTRDHDVRQNIAALLQNIEARAPFAILDLGCGPGRDLVAFTGLGHVAVGVEGAATLAAMARANSGCEVWQQDLLALDLPKQRFDGVFANAVLFHVPSQELSRVLRQLHETLKPGGVLFSSNPHGRNEEGWHGERYAAYHDLQTWRRHLVGAGFVEVDHYYRPTGLPFERQPWLASVWRRR